MANHIEEAAQASRAASDRIVAAQASMSPGYVRRQLRTMDEMILSIRDAAKAGKIDLSHSDRELLASEVWEHARRVTQLSLEIGEGK